MRIIKLRKVKSICGLHYNPDGQRLLVCCGYEVRSPDEAIWVDVAEGREISRFTLAASCYAVLPDLSKMALGGPRDDEGEMISHIQWFDPTDPEHRHPVSFDSSAHHSEVTSIAWDNSGKRLAVTYMGWNWVGVVHSRTDHLVVADLAPDFFFRSQQFTELAFGDVIAFSPDGKYIAVDGVEDHDNPRSEVCLISTETLGIVHKFTPKGTQTRQLLYSPDGETLAVVNGRNVNLLKADSLEPQLLLGGHPKQVNCVAYTPDGRRILSACHDKQVRIWDANTGDLLQKYDWGLGAVTALSVAPDGITAAAAGEKGQLIIWDLDD